MQTPLDNTREERFWRGVQAAERFFMGEGEVQKALERLVAVLDGDSRGVRDTENGVDIDVILAGSFPGDGKPKPVVFPDPASAAERGVRVALLPLPTILELKLASGMTAGDRLKDLADVQEVIRILDLPRSLADELNPFVRDKFVELWQAVQQRSGGA